MHNGPLVSRGRCLLMAMSWGSHPPTTTTVQSSTYLGNHVVSSKKPRCRRQIRRKPSYSIHLTLIKHIQNTLLMKLYSLHPHPIPHLICHPHTPLKSPHVTSNTNPQTQTSPPCPPLCTHLPAMLTFQLNHPNPHSQPQHPFYLLQALSLHTPFPSRITQHRISYPRAAPRLAPGQRADCLGLSSADTQLVGETCAEGNPEYAVEIRGGDKRWGVCRLEGEMGAGGDTQGNGKDGNGGDCWVGGRWWEMGWVGEGRGWGSPTGKDRIRWVGLIVDGRKGEEGGGIWLWIY